MFLLKNSLVSKLMNKNIIKETRSIVGICFLCRWNQFVLIIKLFYNKKQIHIIVILTRKKILKRAKLKLYPVDIQNHCTLLLSFILLQIKSKNLIKGVQDNYLVLYIL